MIKKHLNNILDRDDYNQAMKQLYDVVHSMLEDYSGIKDTDEYFSQDILNGIEALIIEQLKEWERRNQ